MKSSLLAVSAAALLACWPAAAPAQQAISARAGLINVADGDVFFSDERGGARRPFERKATELVELKEGQMLETEEGRAEILLTPGAFLRIGESAAVRMQSSRLTSVRVEIVRGAALVDVVEMLRDHSLTVLVEGAEANIERPGLYRFDAAPPRIRVFRGEAEVRAAGRTHDLKGGRELALSGGSWAVARFDPDRETDALYRWSKRRAGYIAMANVSAARQAGLMSRSFTGGTWYWNPYFGFATYIPWGDVARSPFGYLYYTPYTVLDVYYQQRRTPTPPAWLDRGAFGGGLADSLPPRSAGSAYTPSAPVSATAPAAPAPGAGSAGTRGGGAVGGATGGTGGGVRAGSGGRGN